MMILGWAFEGIRSKQLAGTGTGTGMLCSLFRGMAGHGAPLDDAKSAFAFKVFRPFSAS